MPLFFKTLKNSRVKIRLKSYKNAIYKVLHEQMMVFVYLFSLFLGKLMLKISPVSFLVLNETFLKTNNNLFLKMSPYYKTKGKKQQKIIGLAEGIARRYNIKKLFWSISQNSRREICAGVLLFKQRYMPETCNFIKKEPSHRKERLTGIWEIFVEIAIP